MNVADRVKETTTATSTAAIALGGAVATFRSFASAFTVGMTNIPVSVDDGAGNWEDGYYTLTAAGLLTRTAIHSSSNGGAAVTFPAGVKTVFCTLTAGAVGDLVNKEDAVTFDQLPALASAAGGDYVLLYRVSDGTIGKLPVSALGGGSSTPTDTTAPIMNGSLTSSNVSASAFSLNWLAASDTVGVTGYEVSRDGGTTWTVAGNVLTYTYTGLTASTAYAARVRAYDAAGNKATPLSLSVTTSVASSDTTAPTMSGSLTTSNVTATGYTMNWAAGSDNVAVTGYETSTDGGTSWSDAGNVTSRAITGATASTTYNLRVRAYDAAGNRSNVLSASVTTGAAGSTMATKYSIRNTDGKGGTAAVKYPAAGNISTNGYYQADVSLYIRDSGGTAALASEVVTVAWSKRSGGNPVQPDLSTYGQTGQKRAFTRLGGWSDSDTPNSNGFYGLYDNSGAGTLFIWGTAGTYDLWLFYSDGSAEYYDNGTGSPVGLVLT
jgi:chitodextrinase